MWASRGRASASASRQPEARAAARSPPSPLSRLPAPRRARAPLHPLCAQTAWEGGTYRLIVTFSDDYPATPPACKFDPPLFHPNVFPSGKVCLSILSEDKDWVPTITIKDVLRGVQDLLDNPNLSDPAQREAHVMCKDNLQAYLAKVRALARLYAIKDE